MTNQGVPGSTNDKTQTALDMLARQLQGVQDLLASPPQSRDQFSLDAYWARAKRWRGSTTTLIRTHVSRTEAEKFSDEGYMVPASRAEVSSTKQWLLKQVPFLVALQSELQQQPEAVLPEVTLLRESDIQVTREGIFVRNQAFDAFRLVRDIVRSAQRSIELIDAYISEDTFGAVTPSGATVPVHILTAPLRPGQSRPPNLLTAAQAMKQQYPKFEIREASGFHDRFLIIDADEYYHFGASIKDLGKKVFMFSRIEEDVVKEALRDAWNTSWLAAIVVV